MFYIFLKGLIAQVSKIEFNQAEIQIIKLNWN